MKIAFFKCNFFEHWYLAYFSTKVTQNSYSISSNPTGGKYVSEFWFRPLLIFYDKLKKNQIIFDIILRFML